MYRSSGWSVNQSAGSPSRTPYISSSEQGRLKSTATRNGATSVIAKVTPSGAEVSYAKNGTNVRF